MRAVEQGGRNDTCDTERLSQAVCKGESGKWSVLESNVSGIGELLCFSSKRVRIVLPVCVSSVLVTSAVAVAHIEGTLFNRCTDSVFVFPLLLVASIPEISVHCWTIG